jgi:hypothetical protein
LLSIIQHHFIVALVAPHSPTLFSNQKNLSPLSSGLWKKRTISKEATRKAKRKSEAIERTVINKRRQQKQKRMLFDETPASVKIFHYCYVASFSNFPVFSAALF